MQLSILLYIRCVYVVTYVTFYHLKSSHFSKVYVPSYSFHKGLGNDAYRTKIYFFSHFTHLLCLFPSMSNCITLFTMSLPANCIY